MITLKSYIHYLNDSGRKTARDTYSILLTTFEKWLTLRGKTLDTFTATDVEAFVRGCSNSNTGNMYLASIRGYLKFRSGSIPPGDPRVITETQRYNQVMMVSRLRVPVKRSKVALSVPELSDLLDRIRESGSQEIYDATIVHFYFGARPVELAVNLRDAKINWSDRSMILLTAKTGSDRFLAWNPKVTPYLKRWYKRLPLPYARRWYTKNVCGFSDDTIRITAKTARKTVQTQFRLRGIDDFITDSILGHKSKSPMADRYTDFQMFDERVRDAMEMKHYMVVDEII